MTDEEILKHMEAFSARAAKEVLDGAVQVWDRVLGQYEILTKKIDEVRSELKGEIDQRFTQIDQRFTQIDQRFTQIDQRFVQMDKRFDRLEAGQEQLKAEFQGQGERFDRFTAHLFGIENRIGRLENRANQQEMEPARVEAKLDRLSRDHEVRITVLEATV